MNRILLFIFALIISQYNVNAQLASTGNSIIELGIDDNPSLNEPIIKNGTINFSWKQNGKSRDQNYELRIYEFNDSLTDIQFQKPLISELIQGEAFTGDCKNLGLKNGNTYAYRIRKTNDKDLSFDNNEWFSEPYFFKLSEYPTCTDPKFFKILSNIFQESGTAMVIKWIGNSSDDSYEVYFKLASALTYPSTPTTVATNNTNYYQHYLGNLAANTEYSVKIRAKCTFGLPTFSNFIETTFKTTICAGVTPTLVATPSASGTEIVLNWAANPSHQIYEILHYKDYDSPRTIITNPSSVTNLTLQNLEPTTEYKVEIRGGCLCSNIGSLNDLACKQISSPKSISTTTATPPCEKPTNFALVGVSPCGVSVTWSGIGDFQITATPSSVNNNPIVQNTVGVGSNNQYIITDLIQGQTYNIKIAKLCGTILSDFEYILAPITIPIVCAAPTVTLLGVAPNMIQVNYLSNYGGGSMSLCYKKSSQNNWTRLDNIPNGYLIGGLDIVSKYDFKCFFNNCNGAGSIDCSVPPACAELTNSIYHIQNFAFPCLPPIVLTQSLSEAK